MAERLDTETLRAVVLARIHTFGQEADSPDDFAAWDSAPGHSE